MKIPAVAFALTALSSPAFSACYSGPIDEFYKEFSMSALVQQEAAADMLMMASMDFDAHPEPKLEGALMAAPDVSWPVALAVDDIEAAGGSITYSPLNQDEQIVTVKGNSGYLVHYVFTHKPCWTLRAVLDESM